MWLKKWPTVLACVLGPEAVFAGKVKDAYDHIPDVATDYDELLLMDNLMQREISLQLTPFMKPTWQTQLSQAAKEAIPQWAPAP